MVILGLIDFGALGCSISPLDGGRTEVATQAIYGHLDTRDGRGLLRVFEMDPDRSPASRPDLTWCREVSAEVAREIVRLAGVEARELSRQISRFVSQHYALESAA